MPHERPTTLKPEYYAYLLDRFAEVSDATLEALMETYGYNTAPTMARHEREAAIIDDPSAFLAGEYRLLEKSGPLAGTFIRFHDGKDDEDIDYLVDQQAAEAIALRQRAAVLRRIYDNAPFLVPVERIRNAFKHHCSIDYKEER